MQQPRFAESALQSRHPASFALAHNALLHPWAGLPTMVCSKQQDHGCCVALHQVKVLHNHGFTLMFKWPCRDACDDLLKAIVVKNVGEFFSVSTACERLAAINHDSGAGKHIQHVYP
jgi:hypothetical protein